MNLQSFRAMQGERIKWGYVSQKGTTCHFCYLYRIGWETGGAQAFCGIWKWQKQRIIASAFGMGKAPAPTTCGKSANGKT
jgi:hypothetical protein